MPTETLLLLWLIILVLNASLLWVWYRLRVKTGKRFSTPGDKTASSISPKREPAPVSTELSQGEADPQIQSPASHVGITVDLAEGTRLRMTIEAIPATGDGRSRQVIEITGDGKVSGKKTPGGKEAPAPGLQPSAQSPSLPVTFPPPIPPFPEHPVSEAASWTMQERGLAASLSVATADLLDSFRKVTNQLNQLLTPFISPGEAIAAEPAPLPSQLLADDVLKYYLALSSLGLVTLSLLAWRTAPHQLGFLSLVMASVGVAVIALTFYTNLRKDQSIWLNWYLGKWSNWLGIGINQLLCLGVGVLLVLLAGAAAGVGDLMISPAVAVPAWLLGMVTVILGGWQKTPAGWRLTWRVGIIAALLFLLALSIRAFNTTHIPIALTGDEGNSALSALQFIRGNANNVFKVGWHAFPSIFYYLQSLFISQMGYTIQALRIPSALAGALTVLATYLAGRSMFGNRAGVLAGLIIAGLHIHIHFSRIGLNNIWDGLWYVATLGLLWHGWKNERRASYLLAGVALGASQYFYISSRLLLLLVPIWLLGAGWLDRPRLKRSLPHFVLMGLAALVTFFPLALYFTKSPGDILGPVRQVTIFGPWLGREIAATGQPVWRILLRQIGLGFGAFTFTPLKYWYHPGVPLLRPIPAAFFLLGLVLLTMRLRNPRNLLIAGWLITSGLTGAFSESTPAAQRYMAGIPACALVVGYSLDAVISRLAVSWPGKRQLVTTAALLLVLLIPLDDARFYFLEYTPNSYLNGKYDFAGYGSAVAQYLADYLQDKSSDWRVYFFGGGRMGYYSISSLPYLTPHIQGTDMKYPWGSPNNPQVEGEDLIFVILPESKEDLPGVQRDYPGGVLSTQKYRDGTILYYLYEYSAEKSS